VYHKKTLQIKSGFTLIELLVVIAIIAILSIVGLTAYSGAQKGARDARRKVDIDAVVNAYEVNKTTTQYITLSNSYFASSQIPFDPLASSVIDHSRVGCGDTSAPKNNCYYCFKAVSSSVGYCDSSTDYDLNNATAFASSTAPGAAGVMVCANLEAGNPKYYCKSSAQ